MLTSSGNEAQSTLFLLTFSSGHMSEGALVESNAPMLSGQPRMPVTGLCLRGLPLKTASVKLELKARINKSSFQTVNLHVLVDCANDGHVLVFLQKPHQQVVRVAAKLQPELAKSSR
jgi:hypothetical protein